MKKILLLIFGVALLSFGAIQKDVQAQNVDVISGFLEVREDQIFVGEEKISMGGSAHYLQNTISEVDYNKNKQLESLWDEIKLMRGQFIAVSVVRVDGNLEVVAISGQEYENPALKDKKF